MSVLRNCAKKQALCRAEMARLMSGWNKNLFVIQKYNVGKDLLFVTSYYRLVLISLSFFKKWYPIEALYWLKYVLCTIKSTLRSLLDKFRNKHVTRIRVMNNMKYNTYCLERPIAVKSLSLLRFLYNTSVCH